MAYPMEYPVLKAQGTWFTNPHNIAKTSITKITVDNSYTPNENEDVKSWDASEAGDGSIMVYVSDGELTIACNGSEKIAANIHSNEMFRAFNAVKTISGLELVDTSAVTTFERAFAGCTSVTAITDISAWDTGLVGSVYCMFQQTYLLKDAPVGDWDMTSCTTAGGMFQLAKGLSSVVLRWKAPVLTSALMMFGSMASPGAEYEDCLEKVDLTGCEFGSTLDAGQMFIFRTKLTDVIGIDRVITQKCSSIDKMFSNCTGLKSLDLTGCDTSGCSTTYASFASTNSLEAVTLGPKFSFDNFGKITGPGKIGVLPTPVSGRWYTADGGSHLPNSIVDGEGRTFYARRNMVEDFDTVVKNSVLMDIADATRTATGLTDSLKPSQISHALQGFDHTKVSNPVLDATFLSGCFREVIDTVVFVKEYTPEEEPMFAWNADVGQTGAIRGYVGGSPPSIAFIQLVEGDKIRLAPNSSGLLADMPGLEEVRGIELLDVSNVEFFDRAFSGCETLKTVRETDSTTTGVVDLSSLTFPKLKSYKRAFEGCANMESLSAWQGLTNVSYAMFHRCVSLKNISGLSGVTRIDDRAFVYTPELAALDLDATKIAYIGESACRLSSIEDVINLDNVPEVGNQATRLNRWPNNLKDVQTVDATAYIEDWVASQDTEVELEVPNPDRQTNYPHIPFGKYKGRNLSVATSACGTVQKYHEWNLIHHKYNTGKKVYPNFPAWMDAMEEEGAKKFVVCKECGTVVARGSTVCTNNACKSTNLSDGFRWRDTDVSKGAADKILGWTRAKHTDHNGINADTKYVSDEKDMINVLRHLNNGLPVEGAMYSAHSVMKMHGMLIVGFRYNSTTKKFKFAIIDPNVWGIRGVVTWHKFEDIFNEHTHEYEGGVEENGMDHLNFVVNYNCEGGPTIADDNGSYLAGVFKND